MTVNEAFWVCVYERQSIIMENKGNILILNINVFNVLKLLERVVKNELKYHMY